MGVKPVEKKTVHGICKVQRVWIWQAMVFLFLTSRIFDSPECLFWVDVANQFPFVSVFHCGFDNVLYLSVE